MATTERIDVVVDDVNGRKRVAFKGMSSMQTRDTLLREHRDTAEKRFPIQSLESETKLGEMVLTDGQYSRTEWVGRSEIPDPRSED